VIIACVLTAFFEVFANLLIHIYLGNDFSGVAALIRTVCLGVLPFALYCVLRSLIDAYYTKAVNMLNNGISFLVFAGAAGFLFVVGASSRVVVAFLLAILVLGILTIAEVWKILGRRVKAARLEPVYEEGN
jgi:O-antigen/teichoic acid export membrane protein